MAPFVAAALPVAKQLLLWIVLSQLGKKVGSKVLLPLAAKVVPTAAKAALTRVPAGMAVVAGKLVPAAAGQVATHTAGQMLPAALRQAAVKASGNAAVHKGLQWLGKGMVGAGNLVGAAAPFAIMAGGRGLQAAGVGGGALIDAAGTAGGALVNAAGQIPNQFDLASNAQKEKFGYTPLSTIGGIASLLGGAAGTGIQAIGHGAGTAASIVGNAAGSTLNDLSQGIRMNQLRDSMDSRILSQAVELEKLNLSPSTKRLIEQRLRTMGRNIK